MQVNWEGLSVSLRVEEVARSDILRLLLCPLTRNYEEWGADKLGVLPETFCLVFNIFHEEFCLSLAGFDHFTP